VLKELRSRHPKADIQFWCDTHFAPQARSIMGGFDSSIPVQTIAAGKFRRYHHLTALQHILWPSLMWANLKDVFKVAGGLLQSLWKLIWWRPDVIFTKGGYVCLPVGMAAHILRIPLVIHDSDAHPGLTNRVLSRWATSIGTGAPLEYYQYPADRSRYVGIPINEAFRPYSSAEQQAAKKEWGISTDKPLLVVTGGGLGAKRLNAVVAQSLDALQHYVSVVLVAGTAQYDELREQLPADGPTFQLHPFINNIHTLLGAADIVATRAGATTILELAALQKPTILVPNAALTGGHQLKNAAVYEEAQVAIVVNEDAMVEKPDILVRAVKSYLDDPKTTATMARRFGEFARPNAAKDMADMILKAARTGRA
jgi:UDP-N-acetylglucosamine--N-acetylmuramyl-(pentapeptide) pyrophosphoryl-undecaprenol N-acetylglucosamine transferase